MLSDLAGRRGVATMEQARDAIWGMDRPGRRRGLDGVDIWCCIVRNATGLDRLNSRKIVTALLTVLATGLALGFVYEDDATAAAKRKPPLKILWALVSLVPWRCTRRWRRPSQRAIPSADDLLTSALP